MLKNQRIIQIFSNGTLNYNHNSTFLFFFNKKYHIQKNDCKNLKPYVKTKRSLKKNNNLQNLKFRNKYFT